MMLMNASMFIHRGSWYSYTPNPIPPIPARNPLNLQYKPITRWEAVTNEDWQDINLINILDEENDEDFNMVDYRKKYKHKIPNFLIQLFV